MTAYPHLTVVTHTIERRACQTPDAWDDAWEAACPHGHEPRWRPGDHDAMHVAAQKLREARGAQDRWVRWSWLVFVLTLVGVALWRWLGWA